MAKSQVPGRTPPRPVTRGAKVVPKRRSSLPLILGIGALVVLAALAVFVLNNSSSTATLENERAIEPYASDPAVQRDHVDGTAVQYTTNPPVGGNHWSRTATWGVQTVAPPDQALVHNLEHGGVVIWYDPAKVDAATVERLRTFTRTLQTVNFRVVLTPRATGIENGKAIAMTSWGYIMSLDGYDEGQLRGFFNSHINEGPECQNGQCPR